MKKFHLWKFIFAVILAGMVDDSIHIFYGHFAADIPIYPTHIIVMSYLTKPLEALGVAIVYYLMGDRLYSNSRFIKAIILTLIVCLIVDGLLRQPFMNVLLNHDFFPEIYRESQTWLAKFGMCLVLVFMIEPKKR